MQAQRIAALAAICTLSMGASSAAAKVDPGARTQQLIDAFIAVKAIPDDGSELSAADKAANQKVFAKLDSLFDFDALSEKSLGPHIKKFSAAQQKHFKDTFRQLIRLVAYPDSGAFLKTAKRKNKGSKVKGKTAEVLIHLDVEEEDIQMDATFYWKGGAAWRLIDVAFDGDPMSKDYQNQFGRIIGKVGVDGLLKKLDKRLEKELEQAVL